MNINIIVSKYAKIAGFRITYMLCAIVVFCIKSHYIACY